MGKPTILLLPNKVYHVWTHANGSENLFRENQNYHYFLQKYGHYINPVANTFAYCLMPNHLHLMIKIKSEAELIEWAKLKKPTLGSNELVGSIPLMVSKQFSHLFNGYTQAYNKLYRRMGSLFIPNFNRKHVDSESYYTRLIAYIHLNPVHHGFVTDPGAWPFSSWHGYLSDKSQMIARNEPIGWFSSKEAFRQFHKDFKKVDIWKEFDFN